MTSKEISVFIIGIMLIAFLYLMKNSSHDQHDSLQIQTQNSQNIDFSVVPQPDNFDPNTNFPTLESILDIPAWTFDIDKLEAITSEELVTTIQQSIEEGNFFEPENDNAFFYLINLKSIDNENPQLAELSVEINKQLSIQAQQAIEKNDEKQLISVISRTRTLDENNPNINHLKDKLATIKTINKLYSKGLEQIQNNLIVTDDSVDAWHTAKQCMEVDPHNSKAQKLVFLVNSHLINNALRAAEETDFQLAQIQIEQAQMLASSSAAVTNAQIAIDQLKQKRYVWLEQQITRAIERVNIPRAKMMMNQLAQLGLAQSQINEYQNVIERLSIFGKYLPLDSFSDQTLANEPLPKMVVMPTNSYLMGSIQGPKHEKPAHQVNINYGFAVSQNEISVADFKLFMETKSYRTDAEKNHSSRIYDLRTGRLKNKNRVTWHKDYLGKTAHDPDPVIHVSWNDAIAYSQWLSQQTGKNYRLLTESEFEYILRAGTRTLYPWGNGTPTQVIENITGKLDRTKQSSRIKWKKGFDDYNDGYWGPAPVGSFIPNQLKLNDTAGNVMEWVMDCWHDSYTRAPIDGSSWTNPGCEDHVIRGGSWSSSKNEFISSHRFKARANFTDARLGFRIAVDLQ